MSPYGRCYQRITVKDKDFPSVCEGCGNYYDWSTIFKKYYFKECPECKRREDIQSSINFCDRHGDKIVRMELREDRI
jgi:hypothetical protein